MENIIDTLFGNVFISNIYFVDSNPGEIETIEVRKINSEIKEIKKTQSFDLSTKTIEKRGLPSLNIRECVKHSLIVLMNFNSNNFEFKYFEVNFFKRLFYKRDPKKIVDLFKESDWIITSEDIIYEFSNLEDFEHMSGYGDIRLVGKIGKTMIFKMNDIGNLIYIGEKESITAVFNRNISKNDNNDIQIEYLLKANDRLKKIIVH